ncbi:hypothetical protein EB796_004526 [Bugula neritina]|uniref:Uncharacterized protein n=1 Tax=Bugula neritina TaxID=10212 RepID=A0A7J7KI82_BUGNE|nr:hypothetical protein EB796_004526 [Bugula neritina]
MSFVLEMEVGFPKLEKHIATQTQPQPVLYNSTQLAGLVNMQYAWILTREKTVSSEDMKKYLDIFKKNGVNIDSFDDILQDCSDN